LALDADLRQQVAELAQRTGTPAFMVLQASLAAVFTRLGAGTDIPLGTPIAGRTDEALDELVGFFVNTLVLRTDTSGDPSFTELLARVRETSLAAYAHQDVPFEYLVEELNPRRSSAHHPLFQVMFALQNAPEPDYRLPGVRVTGEPIGTGVSRVDLSVNLAERYADDGRPAGVLGWAEYATDLFDAADVAVLVGHWQTLLEHAVREPDLPVSRLELMPAGERELVGSWSG
ncbi:hypothetical protein K6C39_21980, partial [Vibrio vulnificus]|nr:hypothetical protein [Vibrio vulnificus]